MSPTLLVARRSLLVALALLLGVASTAQAGRRHHGPPPGCATCDAPACQPQVITKTILVPYVEYKTMIVQDVVCKPVLRQKTVPVTRWVPETTMVVRRIPVVTPEARTRIETYTVCHRNFETVNDTVTVPVPHTEMRQGIRTVCNMVKETVMRTVIEEGGHYEDLPSQSGPVQKGGPEQAPLQKGPIQKGRVWVPEVIKRQVPVVTYRPEYVQVPYEYPVTVCRLEARNITRTVPRPRYETKEREVHYTVPVTTFVEREVPHTVCKPVTEEQVITYTEFVREPIERRVTVPVCTMVEKTVTCTVGCAACGH